MKRLNFKNWSPWRSLTKNYPDICPYCSAEVRMEFVHGHYQCAECKSVINDCCDGEVNSLRDKRTDTPSRT